MKRFVVSFQKMKWCSALNINKYTELKLFYRPGVAGFLLAGIFFSMVEGFM
jgi:hypothetical protein